MGVHVLFSFTFGRLCIALVLLLTLICVSSLPQIIEKKPNNMSLDDLINDIMFGDLNQPNVMSSSNWIKEVLFNDSDECQFQLILSLHGQSSSSRSRKRIEIDREAVYECLFRNYFAPNLVCPLEIFR